MKVRRPMHTTGAQLERLLFNSGAAERPDTDTVQKAARALDLFPNALLAGGVLAFVVRNVRRVSVAVGTLVPLGAVAIAVVVVSHPSGANIPVGPSHAASTAIDVSPDPPVVAPAIPPALEQTPYRSIDTTPPPHTRAPRRSKVHASNPSPRTTPPIDNLSEQAETLNRARALLEAGQTSTALAVIDDYDGRFQGRPLSEEALLLRIEGLAQRGDREAAKDLCRRFLAKYPASVHLDQVSALLGSCAQ
jgi:hypothetical protein